MLFPIIVRTHFSQFCSHCIVERALPVAPFPIAADCARKVHARLGPEVEHVVADLRPTEGFLLRYQQRIRYPQTLEVLTRVSHLGSKSWTMAYELRSAAGELLASGQSVQVAYDHAANSSMPIAADVRERIRAYEGLPD